MQIGMIGLGRMGSNMVRRLTKGGHACVVYDVHAQAVKDASQHGVVGATSYGLMAAYGEGLNILRHADAGKQLRTTDAETAPLRDPEHYQYELDLPDIAEVWRRGSVIGSWLLDLTASALAGDPDLKNYAGRVSDSGEGRWTIAAAVDEGVPAAVISAALFGRFESRGDADYADRLLSARRKQFGGAR
ncbi:MAG: NAD(P)-binding domain-containing protein [Casimicrobiaceae bacterium]